MDPNDPTRIQPAGEPPPGWPPPPPSPYGQHGGYDAPPTTAYPAAAPPPPPYVPHPAGPFPGGPRSAGPSRGLLITGGVLALLLAGVIGFIVGVQVEKGRKPSSTVATGSQASTTTTTVKASGAGGGRGRTATGTVTAVSSGGFTVTVANGATVNVLVSGRTRYSKTVPGSLQDVMPGNRIVATGARGQNGDITANMVVIGQVRGAGAGGRATTTVP